MRLCGLKKIFPPLGLMYIQAAIEKRSRYRAEITRPSSVMTQICDKSRGSYFTCTLPCPRPTNDAKTSLQ